MLRATRATRQARVPSTNAHSPCFMNSKIAGASRERSPISVASPAGRKTFRRHTRSIAKAVSCFARCNTNGESLVYWNALPQWPRCDRILARHLRRLNSCEWKKSWSPLALLSAAMHPLRHGFRVGDCYSAPLWTKLWSGRGLGRQADARRGDAIRRTTLSLFGGRRVEQTSHGGNAVGRNTRSLGVFANHRFIRGQIHAVDLVARDVAVQPLDVVAQAVNRRKRFL